MKKAMSVFMAVCLILQFAILPCHEAYAFGNDFRAFVEDELGAEGQEYLLTQMDQIQELLASCREDLGIGEVECRKLMIGSPFVVYNEDLTVQEQILYFPIVVRNTKKVVAVISLINTTAGWQYSVSAEWTDELNRSGCADSREDFIFYIYKKKFVVQKSGSNKEKPGKIPQQRMGIGI